MSPDPRLALLLFAIAQEESSAAKPARATPAPEPRFEVRVVKNVAYHSDPDFDPVRHLLDLYLPDGAKGFPFLLFFHGGAWSIGSKDWTAHVGRAFASRRIGVASANYRLSPAVRHPEHVRDAARAFAWLKKNAAEHGGDPSRLFVSGHSAGGHLAALLALDGRRVEEVGCSKRDLRGAIPISGPFELGRRGLGTIFPQDPEERRDAEPAAHVSDDQPPFLIAVAENDMGNLRAQAERMRERLAARGTGVEFFLAEGKTHITGFTFLGQPGDPLTEAIARFVLERSREARSPEPAASKPARRVRV